MYYLTNQDKNLLKSILGTLESVFGKSYIFIISLLLTHFFTIRVVGDVQPPLFDTLSMIPFPVHVLFSFFILFCVIGYFLEIRHSNKRENYIGFILGICLSFSIVFSNPHILFNYPMCFICMLFPFIER